MKQHYSANSAKRRRRREKREAVFGPERLIVRTAGGYHRLECGHFVVVVATEMPHIKRRRCICCLGFETVAEALEGSPSCGH